MTSTPEEFRRAVSLAFGDAVTHTPEGLELAMDDVRLHFAISEGPVRRIGALQLATIRVQISVLSGDQVSAQRLISRVDRATQRGGG